MNPNRQTIDNPSEHIPTDNLRGVPSQGALEGLRHRNEARAKAAIEAMGDRYCCHPANSPAHQRRIKAPPPPLFLMRARAA